MLIRPMMFRAPAGGGGVLRPQDVFATSLYTGTGASQTIVNGLNMAGGGLAWIKTRNSAASHAIFDTARGARKYLSSDTTNAETADLTTLSAFASNGFSIGDDNPSLVNINTKLYIAWSFRRAAKFFDIVTYTGDGAGDRAILHNLGIKPGLMIVKRLDAASDWPVYHRSLSGPDAGLRLNTSGAVTGVPSWDATDPDATKFWVSSGGLAAVATNVSGARYVAYLFAHDPDPNGIIQCGSFTTDANEAATVTLGWRPQCILVKSVTTGSWYVLDTARGWDNINDRSIQPNTSTVESNLGNSGSPTATGFTFQYLGANTTFIFLAIRAPI